MFSFVPQIIKVVKLKSAHDVSLMMIIQMGAGVGLWAVYGIARRDPIIILANTVSFVTLIILLFLYFAYGRDKRKETACQ